MDQGLVHTLSGQTHQIGQFLLRDAQQIPHARKQHWIEQGRQVSRHPQIGIVQTVKFSRGNELTQALVQLVHHKAVKTQRIVDQPIESIEGQTCHHTGAQGLDVVTVDLALQGRALAKPTPWRHTRKGHGLAIFVVAAHFQ